MCAFDGRRLSISLFFLSFVHIFFLLLKLSFGIESEAQLLTSSESIHCYVLDIWISMSVQTFFFNTFTVYLLSFQLEQLLNHFGIMEHTFHIVCIGFAAGDWANRSSLHTFSGIHFYITFNAHSKFNFLFSTKFFSLPFYQFEIVSLFSLFLLSNCFVFYFLFLSHLVHITSTKHKKQKKNIENWMQYWKWILKRNSKCIVANLNSMRFAFWDFPFDFKSNYCAIFVFIDWQHWKSLI